MNVFAALHLVWGDIILQQVQCVKLAVDRGAVAGGSGRV